ncbi:MAG: preprotein translocase subunit SecY [Candidatus Moraniibacteriota bacterium]|nr:MAG: preprotein translocase subunit SecY [Candidatus Moranbacteria bacterium]
MMRRLLSVFQVSELRNKILFIVAILVVYRFAANIPLPGVDMDRVKTLFESSQLLGLLNIFSGGGLSNISIVLLGVGPYITSSIIMQVLTMVVPQFEQMYKEDGEAGRQKFTMITRLITVPLAILQTFGMISLFKSQQILVNLTAYDTAVLVIIATAGTIFLMWLGELITEKKIGNGVSIMIFAGIVAGLPSVFSQTLSLFDSTQLFTYLIFLMIGLITIAGVVFVNEGQRNIPVSYAKRARSGGNATGGSVTTHLPLRVNQAGVIPIIFAVSIVLFPSFIGGALVQFGNENLKTFGEFLTTLFNNQWVYGMSYFILVLLFTYFYTAVVFDPKKIAENLQKQGGFIPGIRPGRQTEEYLSRVTSRITLFGSLFLGLIAVLPIIVQGFTNISTLTLGGTSILIAVSVVVEMVKQIESQLVMRRYDIY